MKVCFDTQILVWGIRENCSDGQEDNILYAKELIKQTRENGDEIIVPSIVTGEILLALPIEHHPLLMNLIDMACTCVPFDLGCAGRFATIWKLNKNNGTTDALKKEGNKEGWKHELKADCLIVATAIQNGVDIVYSNDKRFRNFAEEHIKVEDLPKIVQKNEQLDLFPNKIEEDSVQSTHV